MALVAEHQIQQGRNVPVLLGGVSKWQLGVDFVMIAAALVYPSDVPGLLQLGQDPLHAALCDPYGLRHLPHTYPRLLSYAQKDMRVVGEEGPGRLR